MRHFIFHYHFVFYLCGRVWSSGNSCTFGTIGPKLDIFFATKKENFLYKEAFYFQRSIFSYIDAGTKGGPVGDWGPGRLNF